MVDINLISQEPPVAYNLGHMPIITHWCDRLNLEAIFDDNLNMKANVPVSVIVKAMVLDTLHGRSPLYHLEESFTDTDNELLFGKPYVSSEFNDDAVGRALDRIHKYGCEKIYTELSLEALKTFSLKLDYTHYDTTSVNVWGTYAGEPSDGCGPNITHGYSKDKRPDLKQFMIDLMCVEGNIPILGRTKDGNSSDEKLNNEILMKLRDYCAIADRDEGIYVADCKVVTPDNLTGPLNGKKFVSRLPATYGIHNEVILKALEKQNWQELGTLSETESKNTNRPSAIYKVSEEEITLYDKKYRAIVVHTSAKDKRKSNALEARINKEHKALTKDLKSKSKLTYSCKKDCEKSLTKILKKAPRYHKVEALVEPRPIMKKGRIKEGEERAVERYDYGLVFSLSPNQPLIKQEESMCGCFVLIASIETQDKSPQTLLKAYKGQTGVEGNFRFLKDPLIVNDLFLKKPERIEALGLILTISLLVYNLIQRSMRLYVKEQDTELIGFDKKMTRKPTTYMISWAFKNFMIIKQGKHRIIGSRKRENQRLFLKAMHMDYDIFTEIVKRI